MATTETAILAGGCFWGAQQLLRRRPGVLSSRVGYSGGATPNATYRNHGDHAEAVAIVFDPSLTDYVLVSQDRPQIEHFRRQGDGTWTYRLVVGLRKKLVVEDIGVTLKLADVYDRVKFADE